MSPREGGPVCRERQWPPASCLRALGPVWEPQVTRLVYYANTKTQTHRPRETAVCREGTGSSPQAAFPPVEAICHAHHQISQLRERACPSPLSWVVS